MVLDITGNPYTDSTPFGIIKNCKDLTEFTVKLVPSDPANKDYTFLKELNSLDKINSVTVED